MPADFRTYEAQKRLLTAVIASNPGMKLNYKEICAHYGSDWSESGIEHFFRPIKKNAKAVQAMVKRNEDPATFNHESFQFRQIKRDAEDMRQGKGSSTPTAAASKTPKTPRTIGSRKRAAPSTTKSAASKKLKEHVTKFVDTNIDDDDDDEEGDYPFSINPCTPSKLPEIDYVKAAEYSAGKYHEKVRAQKTAATAAAAAAAASASTQVTTPEGDDVQIIERGPAFSFVQETTKTQPSSTITSTSLFGDSNNNNNTLKTEDGDSYSSYLSEKHADNDYSENEYGDEC